MISPRLPCISPALRMTPLAAVSAFMHSARISDRARRNVASAISDASASIRLNDALVPPKPKEFDSTVPSFTLSLRLRTIGMSANTRIEILRYWRSRR